MSIRFVEVPEEVKAAYEEVARDIGVDLDGDMVRCTVRLVDVPLEDGYTRGPKEFLYRLYDVGRGVWNEMPVELGTLGTAAAVKLLESQIRKRIPALQPEMVTELAVLGVGMVTKGLNFALSYSTKR